MVRTKILKTTVSGLEKKVHMKTYSKILAVAICVCSCAMIQATCSDHNHSLPSSSLDKKSKIYLSPGSLSMDNSCLYVSFAGELFPVKQVLTDEYGVYINKKELENSKYGIWICPKGHPNPPWNLVCAACSQ